MSQRCIAPYEPEHNTALLIYAASMAGEVGRCHSCTVSPSTQSALFSHQTRRQEVSALGFVARKSGYGEALHIPGERDPTNQASPNSRAWDHVSLSYEW